MSARRCQSYLSGTDSTSFTGYNRASRGFIPDGSVVLPAAITVSPTWLPTRLQERDWPRPGPGLTPSKEPSGCTATGDGRHRPLYAAPKAT